MKEREKKRERVFSLRIKVSLCMKLKYMYTILRKKYKLLT